MKRFWTFTAVFALLASGTVLSLQQPNPQGQATLGQVTIDFGRPSTRGRDVMALMPAGSYWRMGSDIDTSLETGADLSFGNQTVPSGAYSLLAHLKENGEDWELVICKGVEEGFRPRDTVAVVPFELSRETDEIDRMMIELLEREGQTELLLSWGVYRLSALFSQGSAD